MSFFLAIFGGSLIQTWLFINTLQLIAHLPLISQNLPANAHYFLLNFLSLVRLSFESLNSSIDQIGSQMEQYELAASEDTSYSFHFHNCGYHFSFARNMLFGISLAILLVLIWIFTAVIEFVRRHRQGSQEDAGRV